MRRFGRRPLLAHRQTSLVAADVLRLTDRATLIGKSAQALDFNRAHSYETEQGKRIEALNDVLAEGT